MTTRPITSTPGYYSCNSVDIDSIRAALATINDEIVYHESELKRLKELELEYQKCLSPFHRIPTEVLEYIFEFAVEKSSVGCESWHCRSDTHDLEQVCRKWRNIVQSTPHLWTIILLKIHPSRPYPSEAFRRLEDLLLRSQSLPLSLELQISPNASGQRHESSTRFFDLVLQQSHRWKSFKYVQMPETGLHGRTPFLNRVFRQKMGALKSLQVVLDQRYDQDVPPAFKQSIMVSPLQTVHLSFSGSAITPFLKIFGTLPLTRLRIEVDTRDAIPLLCSCRNIVTAHFVLVKNERQTEVHSSMIPDTHRTLRTLTIEPLWQNRFHQISFFLCALTCPSLTSLSIITTNFPYEHPVILSSLFTNSLINFLRRSESPKILKSFRLVEIPIRASHIIQVLHVLPSLCTLEIHSITKNNFPPLLDSTVFRALNSWPTTSDESSIYPRKTVALPMLCEARFTISTDWEDNAFENMLQSRVEGELKSVFLNIRGKVKDLDIGWLERINAKSDLAVRVIEGDDEKEVVGYWVKPVVGLRRYCWEDRLSI